MATDDRLLYEAHAALVPWAKDDDHVALHFIIEGRNADFFLCQGDADDLAFWQAVSRLWVVAPKMQLRLKEARDVIAQMPKYALGTASRTEVLPSGEAGLMEWAIRDELLDKINRAIADTPREAKGEQ